MIKPDFKKAYSDLRKEVFSARHRSSIDDRRGLRRIPVERITAVEGVSEMIKLFVLHLDRWARCNSLRYTVTFFESEDSYEVQIFSAAPQENYYRKRSYDFDCFLEMYEEDTKVKTERPRMLVGPEVE